MKRIAIFTCALTACLPTVVNAAPAVYPGCSVPTLQAGHHTFYVDPAKGTPGGDGSLTKPWRTLAEVLNGTAKLVATQRYKRQGGVDVLADANQTGPIKPGDVIMLMNGNHGDVFIQGAVNKDFITVMPAPGQTPVLNSLRLQSSQKWAFQGLKVVPDLNKVPAIAIVVVGYADGTHLTTEVSLDNLLVGTVEDASGWSSSDWMRKPKLLGIWFGSGGTCASVTNSHLTNIVNGIALGSEKTLVKNNLIDRMLNDGIDVTASNVTIASNTIKDGVNVPESKLHADGIQGWSASVKGVTQTTRNVVIDGNTLIKTGDGSQTYMQGISIFDGKWDNLTISNNSIAVNTWNGIVASGPTNSKIINNTVVATDAKYQTRLSVAPAGDKTLPSNTVVRNNITSALFTVGNNMTVDHNIADYSINYLGKPMIKTGAIGDNNTIVSAVTSGFVSFNRATSSYDLRLRNGSPAIAAGDARLAPSLDILGKKRTTPVDNGAYAH